MHIVSSQLTLAAAHQQASSVKTSERLQVWAGNRKPIAQGPVNGEMKVDATPGHFLVVAATDSATGVGGPKAAGSSAAQADSATNDKDMLDLAILLRALGASDKEVSRTLHNLAAIREAYTRGASAPASGSSTPSAPSGGGATYERDEVRETTEQTFFSAEGSVTTADGRSMQVDLLAVMQRAEIQTESVSVRAGDAAAKVDPLVLNLDGGLAAFSGSHSFDIDGDGRQEEIARLAAGSAYLALDQNGNGSVDDGRELFGPASGNGFADLARYDSDSNGWIDEADPVFQKLGLWSPGGDGDSGALVSLQDSGVGAICLANAATPFSIRDDGKDQAAVASTGIYLKENGEAGTVQHVDLMV